MTRTILFFLSMLFGSAGFTESLIINNKAPYPAANKKSKMVVQWANSAKDVEEINSAIKLGLTLNSDTFQAITQSGKINLAIPKKAEYFRVLVWSNGNSGPDFLTNWIDVVPNKIYTLDEGHLVPIALMSGMGC